MRFFNHPGELGFDYLRDQMAPSPSELALREKSPFNFAVVDEATGGPTPPTPTGGMVWDGGEWEVLLFFC